MRARTILQLSSLGALPIVVAVAACASADNVDPSQRGFYFEDAGRDATANLPPPPEPVADGGKDASRADAASEPRDPFTSADEPVSCAAGSVCAKQIVAGKNHFCVLMTDGTARCWGTNEYGALGSEDESSPVRVVGDLTDATQLSASRFTTCARKSDGSAQCWGSNSFGNLGIVSAKDGRPTWDESPHPRASNVSGLTETITRVDVGPQTTCAVLTAGGISCWGTNQLHQLARPAATADFVMAPGAASLSPYVIGSISGSTGTMLGRTTTGEVVSWAAVAGDNGFVGGRFTSISPDPAPNNVNTLKGVTSLAVTESLSKGEGGPLGVPDGAFGPFPPPPMRRHAHACAIANGEVFCWGRSDTGALCTGLPDDEIVPRHAPIKGVKPWPQQLALGDELTCARMTDGSVQCCGADGRGRLGTNAKGERVEVFNAFFRRVDSFKGYAVQIATSDRAVCALLKDGSVECWGANPYGELALPADEVAHPAPVKVVLGASKK
jgi:alpha-tubulin suppressor-like RCC1 family protein